LFNALTTAAAPATPEWPDCRQAGVARAGGTHRLHQNIGRCEPLRRIVWSYWLYRACGVGGTTKSTTIFLSSVSHYIQAVRCGQQDTPVM